jgi:mannitol-1-phosphate/altronate dehydrogenase
MTRLGSAVLHDPPLGVATPAYDRERATVGVVHFGVGAFHQAHQAVYLDQVMAAGDLQWHRSFPQVEGNIG